MPTEDSSFDDLFAEDDEDLDPGQNNSAFKRLRDHAKKLDKKLKASEKEIEELRTYRETQEQEKRSANLRQAFSSAGLSEKHADLFEAVKKDVEPTELAIKEFAKEYQLSVRLTEDENSQPDDEQSSEESTDAGQGYFEPNAGGGNPPKVKRLDGKQLRELYDKNPAEALKLLREGRVDLKTEQ